MAKKPAAGGRHPPLRRRPRAAHHREVDAAVGAQRGRLQGRRRRDEARDQGRGRGAVQRQGDRRQHDRHQGQDQEWKGKPYKRSDVKKAIVTLAEGQSIDITSGI